MLQESTGILDWNSHFFYSVKQLFCDVQSFALKIFHFAVIDDKTHKIQHFVSRLYELPVDSEMIHCPTRIP